MGTHPIFESDFDCLTERELFDAIYSKLGVALNGMDIVQSLNDLEKRLLDLRQRTAAKIEPQVAPVSKPDSSEILLNSMKSRTDDLSKSSLNVLKHYANKDMSTMTHSELVFYKRYVLPVIHLLK